jgi:hypothetical protein
MSWRETTYSVFKTTQGVVNRQPGKDGASVCFQTTNRVVNLM